MRDWVFGGRIGRAAALALSFAAGVPSCWAGQASSATVLTVSAVGGPVTTVNAGTAATLTATVTSAGAGVTPGQVNFCNAAATYCTDNNLLGTAQLTSAGTAVWKFVPAPGVHQYKAVFRGTNGIAGSTSATAVLTVVAAGATSASAVGVQASGQQGDYSLLGTVAVTGSARPTGTVSFLDTSNGGYQLAAGGLLATGSAETSFRNSFTLPIPRTASADYGGGGVGVADFNGDGIPDIAACDASLGTISILLGKGDGTFTSSTFSVNASYILGSLVVGDFNSDGKIDFAVSLGTAGIGVYLGNGDGTFTAGALLRPVAGAAGLTGQDVLVGDFNGDGVADLAVAVETVSSTYCVQVFLGKGDGTFSAQVLQAQLNDSYHMVAADFNGDGKLDIASTSFSQQTLTVLLGNGDGTFTAAPTVSLGIEFLGLAAGDLNGDGKVDLVVSDQSSVPVTVLLGKGDGTFVQQTPQAAINQLADTVALADFSGDGILDMLLPDTYGGTTNVFLGKGDGTFATDSYSPARAQYIVFRIATADLNGDGLADVVEAIFDNFSPTPNDDQVDVLLAQPANTSAAYVSGISPVGTGIHYIDASYPGDSNYSAGISATIPLLAQPVATSTAVTATPGRSVPGQAVTLTATVSPDLAQNHNATGFVTFSWSGTNLVNGTLSGGVATITTNSLPTGTTTISAAYSGDTNFASSGANFTYTVAATAAQTITFPQPATPAFPGISVTLGATASSGLAVTYTVVSGPATVSGSVLTYTGTGTVVVEADQAGNSAYGAAAAVQVTVQVVALAEPVGTSSPVITETMVITKPETVNSIQVLTQGVPGLDFTYVAGGTCAFGITYAAGQTCTVEFTYKPTKPGPRYGGITLQSNTGAIATTYLQGIGTGPQVNYRPGTTTTLPFSFPAGRTEVAVDAGGDIFFCVAVAQFSSLNEVVEEMPDGSGGYRQRFVAPTGLGYPVAVAVDGLGNVFVVDQVAQEVEEFSVVDNVYEPSNFFHLGVANGVAVDGTGNVYIATNSYGLVKESFSGTGYVQSTVASGSFSNGLAVDGNGTVYSANGQMFTPHANGIYTAGTFSAGGNTGVAVDANDNVYVTQGPAVYEYALAGGTYTQSTLATGAGTLAAVAVDGSGNVYYTAAGGGAVYELDVVDPPSLVFATTPPGATSSDSPKTVTVLNAGNAPLIFSSGTNPTISLGYGLGAASTCGGTLAANASCTELVSFTPIAPGPDSGKMVTTDNNLNAAGATQTVLLNGIATGTVLPPVVTGVSPNTGTGAGGTSVTITGTSLFGATAVSFGGVAATSFAVVSPTSIVATSPAGTGVVDVTVTTAGGGTSATSAADRFTYVTPQTIAFPQPATPVYAGTATLLGATASSGLAVTYTVVSGPATLSGAVLTYTGTGTVVVEADQAGGGGFTAAAPVQQTVSVVALTEPVGTASGALSTAVTFTSGGKLANVAGLTQGAAGLDFSAAAGSCVVGTTYAAGQVCTVTFTFAPTVPGMRLGGVQLTSSSGAALASTLLYGLGVGPQVNYLPGTQSTLVSGLTKPAGLAFDGAGNLFLADSSSGLVREATAASGYATLTQVGSGFVRPVAVALDGLGNVYVADYGGGTVSEVLAAGGYTTVLPLQTGLGTPSGVAVDGAGDVFYTDQQTNLVWELAPGKAAKTLGSGFANPSGIGLDGSGNLFVLNAGDSSIRELTASSGYRTAVKLPVMVPFAAALSVNSNGDLFVASSGTDSVTEVLAAGAYTTSRTVATGLLPAGTALDGSGNLYVSDYFARVVYTFDFADAPALTFASTLVGSVSADSPKTVTIVNNGNADLALTLPSAGTNPTITAGFTIGSSSTCPQEVPGGVLNQLAPDGFCTDVVSFQPVAGGAASGKLVTTDNNLNVAGAAQTVLLNGIGTTVGPTIGFTVANHTYGDPPFTVAATSNSAGAFTYAVVSGPATIAGATVTLIGAGTVVLQASEAASGAYTAGSQTATFSVAKEAQTITFATPVSPVNVGAAPVTLQATASSGLPVVFSVLSGPGTVAGSVLTFTGPGTVVVAADQAGNANYLAAAEVTQTVIVQNRFAVVGLTAAPAVVFVQNPVALTASVTSTSGTPTGTVTFKDGGTTLATAPVAGGAATVSLSSLALGTHSITATYGGDANYSPVVSSAATVTVEDFSVQFTAPLVTIAHGGTASYTLLVNPLGGVGTAAEIDFAVTGAPDGSVIAFNPVTLPGGSPSSNVTLTIQTPDYPTGPFEKASAARVGLGVMALAGLVLPFVRRRRVRGVVLAAGLMGVLAIAGCGGGWGAQQFTLNVTASSGQVSRNASSGLISQ